MYGAIGYQLVFAVLARKNIITKEEAKFVSDNLSNKMIPRTFDSMMNQIDILFNEYEMGVNNEDTRY